MYFRNNPYRHKLRKLFAELGNPDIPPDRVADAPLFEFTDADDPINVISATGAAALIPDRVGIIGGGVSGLTAAYEFLRIAQSFKKPKLIRVFEKTPRIGGRVLTHQFTKGAYAELGPMRLPAYHKIALHYVQKLGLHLQTFPSNNATYHFSRVAQTGSRVNGRLVGFPLAEAYNQFRQEREAPGLQYFFPPEGSRPPSLDRVESRFLAWFVGAFRPKSPFGRKVPTRHIEQIEMLDLYSNRPLSELGANVESMAVRQAFIQFVDYCAKTIPTGRRHLAGECGEFLWETFGRALGWVWLEHISMAHFLRETRGFAGGGAKYAIAGGFGRLVDAFVEQLKADPRVSIGIRETVTGVEISGDSPAVKLHFTTPFGSQTEHFDKVVCAAPASAVTKIGFDPPLHPQMHNALSSISYLGASKSAAVFRERFWERDSLLPQLGGVTYTDLENQQIWYPHDNIVYENERGPSPYDGNPPVLLEQPRTPVRAQSEDVSRGPGAVLAAYMWGENSRRFASSAGIERDDMIIRCLETVYPGCSKHLTDLVHWSWDAQSNPGGGAFAWYQPGQHSRYQEVATRPYPVATPTEAKVFFAGEHLGLIQGWLQSAMITALDAVIRACGCRLD
jgi:monoamine oxidase